MASRRPSPCRRSSRALGEVTGSSGTPCGNASGDCREIPDVSADADPSTGYVVYDAVNGLDWTAIGGTSGAAPLWAAVLAVAASADANTAGYGALNPILYTLAQNSPGTYLNDVTSGNNDYNAANGGRIHRDQRVRHGDGAGDARHVGPGDGSHHDPPRRRRLRVAGVRGEPDVRRDRQLRRGRPAPPSASP